MLDKSCCGGNAIILACSGGSNVGQITNEAGKALTGLGVGKLSCAIGVGARLPRFVDSVREAEVCVALDGCPVGCVKTALANVGCAPDVYVVVTELGIAKQPGFEVTPEQVAQVAEAVQAQLSPPSEAAAGCCGGQS